jgi:hypothetical protein
MPTIEFGGKATNGAGSDLEGLKVELYTATNWEAAGAATATTTTDSDGLWAFSAVADGVYIVVVHNADSTKKILFDGRNEVQVTRLDVVNEFRGSVIYLTEQAEASADVAGDGQIWVNTATPNELWFTDDAGNDVQLGQPSSASVAASEAQVEAHASNTVHVTPGRMHFHPGVAKWTVRWNTTGVRAADSYNVTSAVHNGAGTGDWTINLTSGYSAADEHIAIAMMKTGDATTAGIIAISRNDVYTSASIIIQALDDAGGAADPSGAGSVGCMAVGFGDFS